MPCPTRTSFSCVLIVLLQKRKTPPDVARGARGERARNEWRRCLLSLGTRSSVKSRVQPACHGACEMRLQGGRALTREARQIYSSALIRDGAESRFPAR